MTRKRDIALVLALVAFGCRESAEIEPPAPAVSPRATRYIRLLTGGPILGARHVPREVAFSVTSQRRAPCSGRGGFDVKGIHLSQVDRIKRPRGARE